MENSNLQRSALIAEIVSAVAVVVSILFLVSEIRSNTSAQKLVAAQQVLGLSAGTNIESAANFADLNVVMEKYFQGEELSPSENAAFAYFWGGTFSAYWQVHHQYIEGFLSEEFFQAYERRIIESLSFPYMVDFWKNSRFRYPESFQEYVDSLVAKIE